MPLRFSLFFISLFSTLPVGAQDIVVPVLYWSMKIEAQVMMRQGFEETITKYNETASSKIKLIPYEAGEGAVGIQNQVHQLDRVLLTKPDYVVIQPTDNAALIRGLKSANQMKIPVLTYDQFILHGKTESYVTSDNLTAGANLGHFIHKSFPKEKTLRLVLFEYPPVSSTTERIDGFLNALRDGDRDFQILQRYKAVDPLSGEAAGRLFLKDFPEADSVDVIFTVNDGGGLAVIKSLLAKSRKNILHVSVDGDPKSIENLKAGNLTVANSAQYCSEIGREIARQLLNKVSNRKTVPNVWIPTFLVTAKTVGEYKGWSDKPSAVESRPPVKKTAGPFSKVSNLFRSSTTIKIGVAPHCPYLCEGRPGVWSGYLHDILQDVAKKNRFNLDIRSIPNSRLMESLKSRKVDYVISPAYLARYRSDIRVRGPRLGITYTSALVRKKDKMDFISEKNLSKANVLFADLGQESDLDLDSSPKRLLRITGSDVAARMKTMVRDGRIDVALGDFNILSYAFKNSLGDDLELKPTSFTGINPLVLVSSPKNPNFGKLPENLENWMQSSREDGSLQKILDRYGLQDWAQVSR